MVKRSNFEVLLAVIGKEFPLGLLQRVVVIVGSILGRGALYDGWKKEAQLVQRAYIR